MESRPPLVIVVKQRLEPGNVHYASGAVGFLRDLVDTLLTTDVIIQKRV